MIVRLSLLHNLLCLVYTAWSDIYTAHSLVTNEFRQELINRCNYFTDKNVEIRNVDEVEELDKEVVTEDTETK